MAFYRTGGGGSATETVLWTNPSPTAEFGKKSVTLSDDINNYDYIAVEYIYSKSSVDETEKSKSIMSVADFKEGGIGTSVSRTCMALGIINASNSSFTRQVWYQNDTTIQISACYAMTNTTIANGNAVPLQIIGIKEA